MDWIKILPADLEAALNKPQLDILKAESLRSLDRDICQDVIENIIAKIRAEIAASGLNSLDADHSRIPPELCECALRLAIEALQLRVPAMEISALQAKHADIARETLGRIARGELPVSAPIVGIKTASRKRGFSASCALREATRKSVKGL